MTRAEKALEIKHNGNNCCQAVLKAFADETGLSDEQAGSLGVCFGGGMGCMEATCGALCGAQMVLGIRKFQGQRMGKEAKALLEAFQNKCGATLCKDLKGRDTGKPICSCDDCVRYAAELAEEALA